ncbi:enoyl-CoA hydratase/isomerase family protein [bacterium]|nr:enoyl-CoA hydratase/isomerase family protein [bacterium]
MTDFELLDIAIAENGVATVKLNRPPVNALNRQLLEEIDAAFTQLAGEKSARAVVLCGEGKNFAAGADIKEIAALEEGEAVAEFSRVGMRAFMRIADCPIPVVAAVKGFCLGGGCELAMAAHMRVADATAVFGQPEVKLGICPGFAGTQRLPRLIGSPQAIRLLLTGDQVDAEEAHRLGLADVLADDAIEEATKLAGKMARYSRMVVERILRLVQEGTQAPFAEASEMESVAFGEISKTHDMKEGFAAFIEKRRPNFKDE